MRCIEDIAVFYRRKPTYNPQGLEWLAEPRASRRSSTSIYRFAGEADSMITPFSGSKAAPFGNGLWPALIIPNSTCRLSKLLQLRRMALCVSSRSHSSGIVVDTFFSSMVVVRIL